NNVADLQDKLVGVRAGSLAETYMNASSASTKPFNHITDATDALANGEISAIVGDNPVLEYFAHTHPDMNLEVVGNTFQPDKYGFAFRTGSPLTKPASVAIIGAYESGEIEKFRSRYFGFKP
ncbi:MAG: transporter substrate-binding domain-containing protein, partial [Phyllobacterium sp.]